MTFNMSRHAEVRMRQRGIRRDFLAALLAEADIEIPVGGKATLYRVSRELAENLGGSDRPGRYGAIVADDGTVVSIRHSMRPHRAMISRMRALPL